MRELRQSTAQTEMIGPYVDQADGVTEEEGLSTATRITKDGTAFGAGPAITHAEDGWYSVPFTTTHTNTLGSLVIKSQDPANQLPVWHEFMVVTANYYDSKYGTDVRDASVTQWLGTAVPAPGTAGVPSVDVLRWNTAVVAVPTVAGVPEVDLTHMEGGTQTVTDLKDFADNCYVPGTNSVGLVDTCTTNTDMVAEAPTTAQINTEVDTALSDIGLDHLLSAAVVGADVTDNSIMARIAAKGATADWDTFANTTDSLEAIRDEGSANWVTGAGGSDPAVLQNTTIATLATQVSFTLTAGSADDNAYLHMLVVVEDSATSTQKAIGVVSAYTGSSKTITLREDPGVFTMAAGDTVDILAISPDSLDILADTAAMEPKLGTPAADLAADIAAVKAETALILTDTGTTLDTKLNDIKAETVLILADTTVIGAPVGADISADIAAVKAETVLILSDTNAILIDTGTTLSADIAALPTGNENADALLDRANSIETGLTLRQAQRLIAASTAGKLSGLPGGTPAVFREAVADSKARITATTDADGNRTAITWDVS